MAHPVPHSTARTEPSEGAAYGIYESLSAGQRPPTVQDLDVTVLSFAQWLTETRSRSDLSLKQMLAEMSIIRNGISQNTTDLSEFKRSTATVQQQMQSQIADVREKLTDAYTEISKLKNIKSGFEQEVHAEYQSLSEQMQFKTVETETLKKAYAHTHQQLQQQIIQLQSEVNELRLKNDDSSRHHTINYEQSVNKVSEVEMATQYTNNEMKKLRSDHDQAIANLAENMTRWNDTLRDLSKEFHDFQKVMNVNHQRIQSSLWDVQAKSGFPSPSPISSALPSGSHPENGQRLESAGGDTRSPPGARQAATPAAAQLPPQGSTMRGQSPTTAGAAAAAAAVAAGSRRSTTMMAPPFPQQSTPQGPYMMR